MAINTGKGEFPARGWIQQRGGYILVVENRDIPEEKNTSLHPISSHLKKKEEKKGNIRFPSLAL
jgi:hypothetical protein